MNRRGFLKTLVGGIATAVVANAIPDYDPEKLLWIPGAKKLFLPPEGGWRSKDVDPARFNQLLTINQITREALLVLANTLKSTNIIDHRYDDRYANLIGDTIRVAAPARFVPTRLDPMADIPLKYKEIVLTEHRCVEAVGPVTEQVAHELARLLAGRIEADVRGKMIAVGKLNIPIHAESAAVADWGGISVRGIQAFDIYRGQMVTRLDVVYGSTDDDLH